MRGRRVSNPPLNRGGRLNRNKCHANRSPLIDEQPYLLNPETDTPESCFAFDNKGRIKGIDQQGRGKETIKICNLNRDNLRYRRQKIVDDIKEYIIDSFSLYFEKHASIPGLRRGLKQIFERLKGRTTEQSEFTLMHTYCFKHFDQLFLPLMKTNIQRDFLNQSYIDYKNGKL